MQLVINSDAFSKFWYMNFVCNMSTKHTMIVISSKSMTYCLVLFSYVNEDTYRVICNKISILIFLENPLLVHGIFGGARLLILPLDALGGGFKELINQVFLTLKLLFKLLPQEIKQSLVVDILCLTQILSKIATVVCYHNWKNAPQLNVYLPYFTRQPVLVQQ